MRVLLTGGTGYIGSNTAVALLEAGHQVLIVDNLANSNERTVQDIREITNKDVDFVLGDITQPAVIDRILETENAEAVVHFAALKAVGESVEKPLAYYRNNLDGLLTMLESMERHGIHNFIFSSSATVYGGENPVPLTEDMPAGTCANPYGWTKLMAEQILRDAAAANPKMSVVLLRYFNPVGGHRSGKLGERPNGVPNNLMPYIVQTAAGIRERLSVFGGDYPTPDGTGVRDYVHVSDLAEGHVAALEYCVAHHGVETVNLGTGCGNSVLELIHTFETVNGVSVPYQITDRRKGDVAVCWADVEKAGRLLGWQAKRSLKDMCRDSWRCRG
ncbi:MAG: UDP-glucose 4-epimerase GalE [Eubacteriales bacterium]|nr:UDP-glucose 4-epimerase GalE [Eubacteriales bacterium]